MKPSYDDIRSRIPFRPEWHDENGVPRYEAFDPSADPNIYAKEAALFRVECQACGRPFDVALSSNPLAVGMLAEAIEDGEIHYGDPPNVDCCASGATMNSVPRRVLQYWRRSPGWERDESLEIPIEPDWIE